MDVIFESCVILAARYPTLIPSFVTSLLIPEDGNDLATRISVTTYALIAWIIAASGCFLRYYSIKMLGRFFTYRLALRNDHALISSGPYSYVRHPGYTGAIIAAIGTGMFLLGPGSYAYECFALRTVPGAICAAIWVGWKAFAAVNLIRRTAYEDEFLRGQFGKQWDDWARKVGYRLFPGIY
ncbi:ICMT-domain-containing protein [Fomitiporia mediterranea MF3/22]|uniref:ICMT-domain-containing protein n=1 Tax=Fomitiporia mediterranea (strain MF3/22) TaxID=694068 RepID=UPI00044094AF|nr:ICMT-domain-containing protein [Fomitiporia mediterranea MF3/22]EJD00172.1 ICMT-domain-containing protein [Fomitiporia mediterranea MF3/22]